MKLKSNTPDVEQVNYPTILFNLHYNQRKADVQRQDMAYSLYPAELDASNTAARIMNYLCEQDQFVRKNYLKFKTLTKREQEIIKLIVDGQSSYAIAEQLFISVHTVNNHRKNIGKKLDVRSLSELIKFAIAFFII
jgi:DNA-binding CsgD family transcriptional regulator